MSACMSWATRFVSGISARSSCITSLRPLCCCYLAHLYVCVGGGRERERERESVREKERERENSVYERKGNSARMRTRGKRETEKGGKGNRER